MTETRTLSDEQVSETLVEAAKAIHEERSLADALGVTEDYMERVETRAYELYVAERYEEVETLTRGLIAIDPERFYAQLLLGDALTRKKEFKEGLVHLERAHELAPESGLIRFTLGQAYARAGVVSKAKEVLSSFEEDSKYYDSSQAILERIEHVESTHT